MKKITLLNFLIIFCFSSLSWGQTSSPTGPFQPVEVSHACGTMKLYTDEELRNVESFPMPSHVINSNNLTESEGTWSLTQGYGSSCDQDCNITSPAACGGGTYKLPIVMTINTYDVGCTNALISQAEADSHLDIFNDYFICQGIPIELVKSTTYPGAPASGDFSTRYINTGSCTYSDASVVDIPNVLNVYIFDNTGNGTGCNGFAYLPTSSSSPNVAVMGRSCYVGDSYTPGSLSCSSPIFQGANVLIHEVGHYLGLYHTHSPYEIGDPISERNECPDGSNGCTAGDYVSDTDADPNLSDLTTSSSSDGEKCVTRSGCDRDGSACTSPCGTPYPSTSNIEDNIMSYNNLTINGVSCRNTMSPCQKARMVDALLCSRGPQLCYRNVAEEFANGANDANLSICVGEAAPTFTATANCYSWFDDMGSDANALASMTSTFTPTLGTGIGQLDNNTPGVYTWYLGDVNEINPDCRTSITITVFANAGDGSPASSSISGLSTTSLSTDVTSLGDNEIIGWWVTENVGVNIGNFANQSALDVALAAANASGGVISTNMVNHIFQATSGTPTTQFDLSMDCGSLDENITYFATPFISTVKAAVADASCVETDGGSGVTISGDLGQWAHINTGTVSCAPASPPNDPTFTLTINVTAYSGTSGNLRLRVRGNNCSGGNLIAQTVAGVGTYTFTEANFAIGYDPNVSGLCALLYEAGSGASGSGIALNISLDITYPGTAAIPFPTVNYSDCLFGTPVTITCLAAQPVELIYFTARKQNKMAVLNWETETEVNNDYFTVERSIDGRNFTALEKINGAGDSQNTISYQTFDRNPINGLNYYRLKQTDFDGEFTYSNVIAIKFGVENSITIRPNPVAKDAVTLDYLASDNGIVEIEIIDMTGRIMTFQSYSAVAGENQYSFDLSNYNSGVYILRTRHGERLQTIRFVRL